MGWIGDPSITTKKTANCTVKVMVAEHYVCRDVLPNSKKEPCVVYDMGIRQNPGFGKEMAEKFGCEVHAFDPSPVANEDMEWMKEHGLDTLPNYHWHSYGAGGKDGLIDLYAYN